MSKPVRFVRIHGRVVPIKDKGQSKPKGLSTATKVGIAAVAAVATFAVARRFKLSSNFKLARLQAATKNSGVSLSTGIKTPFLKRVQSVIYGSHVTNDSTDVTANIFTKIRHGKKATINPEYVSNALDDKSNFGKVFKRFTPKTTTVEEAKNLKGYIFKPREGSMGKLSDFATSKDLATKTEKGRAVFGNPKGFVAQKLMSFKNEYRAHVFDGEVFGISHRRLPDNILAKAWSKVSGGGGAFVPVLGDKRKQIKDFAANAFKQSNLTKIPSKDHTFFAFDIGDTGKSLKLIEANTSPGTFANPFINRKFKKLATGRWGRDVAGGAAALSGGATYAALSSTEKKR